MNIIDAKKIINEIFNGNIVDEKTIEIEWGWVFYSDQHEGEFPVIMYDKKKKKVIRTRAGNIEKRIEIYTKERDLF